MKLRKIFFSYFPQFHSDPLNDSAWGEGFTDWNLIRELPEALRPAFTPLIGYYDPSQKDYLPQLKLQLASLPFDSGLMVYHYHFDGVYALSGFERQLLEQRSDLPFFFCWANETWSKRWIGKSNEIIVEQRHILDENIIQSHAEYLTQFFNLPGYFCIDGRPLFIIYNPQANRHLADSIELYRKAFSTLGHNPMIGACISHPQPPDHLHPYDFGCEFEPRFFFNTRGTREIARFASRLKAGFPKWFEWLGAQRDKLRKHQGGREFFYDAYLKAISSGKIEEELRASVDGLPLMRSTFLTWDNTPRYRDRSTLVRHDDVSDHYLLALKDLCSDNQLPLLVNSWNEWSEGAALEPGCVEKELRAPFFDVLAQS